ncbi:unnamed protein product [Didymodactylos carnosus]|uniref:MATH domain-containing protein n=1 Tax=Didymodactylos carnosus TaxID=1234261 RepID=A0A8S2IFA0_9BILA|nr:unnamed protein product [Didymodactylos carnosus]CAF3750022.1 unnamed protein product [Didymodactylos carnosus]
MKDNNSSSQQRKVYDDLQRTNEKRMEEKKKQENVESEDLFVHTHPTATAASDLQAELQLCYETLTIVTAKVLRLLSEIDRLKKESLTQRCVLQANVEEYKHIKELFNQSNNNRNQLASELVTLDQESTAVKQKLESLQSILNDGLFVWKIRNVPEIISNAQCQCQTSIDSSPFYSSPNGYKMRIKLYPNGHEKTKGFHMSLFLVMMSGEYDAIVHWPFTYEVTFCLFDQTEKRKHFIKSFRADPGSDSFQRPQSEMNIPIGILEFFSLPIPNGSDYFLEDTMFIGALVDFQNLSKDIRPYVFEMDLGLPSYVRQRIIHEEVTKLEDKEQNQPILPPLHLYRQAQERFSCNLDDFVAELLNNGMDYQQEELIFLPPTLTGEQDRNPIQHRANMFRFADQPPFT